MKRIGGIFFWLAMLLVSLFSVACGGSGGSKKRLPCAEGPRGGCYIVTDSGRKEYVPCSSCE
jgi:hypothetical protein